MVIASLADQLCADPAAVIANLDRDEAAALLSSKLDLTAGGFAGARTLIRRL